MVSDGVCIHDLTTYSPKPSGLSRKEGVPSGLSGVTKWWNPRHRTASWAPPAQETRGCLPTRVQDAWSTPHTPALQTTETLRPASRSGFLTGQVGCLGLVAISDLEREGWCPGAGIVTEVKLLIYALPTQIIIMQVSHAARVLREQRAAPHHRARCAS